MRFGQAILRQRQVHILITAVKLVPHHGMARRSQVDADLMFASCFWTHPQQRELDAGAAKAPFHTEFRQGAGPVGANAMLDSNRAGFVPAQGQINAARILGH